MQNQKSSHGSQSLTVQPQCPMLNAHNVVTQSKYTCLQSKLPIRSLDSPSYTIVTQKMHFTTTFTAFAVLSGTMSHPTAQVPAQHNCTDTVQTMPTHCNTTNTVRVGWGRCIRLVVVVCSAFVTLYSSAMMAIILLCPMSTVAQRLSTIRLAAVAHTVCASIQPIALVPCATCNA